MQLVDLPSSLQRPDLERRLPKKVGRTTPDISGKQLDRSIVIGLAGYIGKCSVWLCRCECGKEFLERAQDLNKSSRSHGCGCHIGESHGLYGTYIYRTWYNAIQRCYNPKNPKFHRYGARGITMCKLWRESASAFAEYMGDRPSPQHSIDRINNDGNYEPGNVRWATRKQQAQNRSCMQKASA